MNLAFTTAQQAIERLESASIVKEISMAKLNRVYCAKTILNILEEPTKLAGRETI